MTEREALKLALEALEAHADIGIKSDKVITAIKETLAQPEQEPVAWRFQSAVGGWAYGKEPPIGSKYAVEPLYTTPPQRKPLTDEMTKQMRERCDSYEMRGAFVDGWVSAEAAHGVKE